MGKRKSRFSKVCMGVYAPVNVTSKKGMREREAFWACLKSFEKDRKLVMMGDMNAKVGDICVMDVVGQWGIPGKNENGEWLMDVCAERGMFLANTFHHKNIHRYTWRRGNDYEQKCFIVYVTVDGRLRQDDCDAKVVRGMFDGSDPLSMLTKSRLKERWIFEKKGGIKKEILTIGKLQEKEIRDEYKQEMAQALNGRWESVTDSTDIENCMQHLKK